LVGKDKESSNLTFDSYEYKHTNVPEKTKGKKSEEKERTLGEKTSVSVAWCRGRRGKNLGGDSGPRQLEGRRILNI